jgi:pimeloyl-ACP methyl ester carboxylesterase
MCNYGHTLGKRAIEIRLPARPKLKSVAIRSNKFLVSRQLAETASARAIEKSNPVSGKQTAYWFYPSSAADAQDIILIHGYRGNHRGLEAIAGALDDFNVYIPDLPGFGKSEAFEHSHSIQNYSQWLGGFIAALRLSSKPILLGHSFGSIICAAFAANSQQIQMLVLENPVSAPALDGEKVFVSKLTKKFFDLVGSVPPSAANWLLKSWPMVRGMSMVMTKSRDFELRRWIHKQHDDNFSDFASTRVALEGYAASISDNVRNYSSRFQVPTLVIIGDRDEITSTEHQQQMADSIPVRKYLSLHQGIGHLTHYESPALVADDIRGFVAANSREISNG